MYSWTTPFLFSYVLNMPSKRSLHELVGNRAASARPLLVGVPQEPPVPPLGWTRRVRQNRSMLPPSSLVQPLGAEIVQEQQKNKNMHRGRMSHQIIYLKNTTHTTDEQSLFRTLLECWQYWLLAGILENTRAESEATILRENSVFSASMCIYQRRRTSVKRARSRDKQNCAMLFLLIQTGLFPTLSVSACLFSDGASINRETS